MTQTITAMTRMIAITLVTDIECDPLVAGLFPGSVVVVLLLVMVALEARTFAHPFKFNPWPLHPSPRQQHVLLYCGFEFAYICLQDSEFTKLNEYFDVEAEISSVVHKKVFDGVQTKRYERHAIVVSVEYVSTGADKVPFVTKH